MTVSLSNDEKEIVNYGDNLSKLKTALRNADLL